MMDISGYRGMGQAAAMFGMYLVDNAQEHGNVHVLTADMAVAASLDRFAYTYPDRFTDVGIAEQNLVSIAAAMASEGFQPVATAQAAFVSMRAFEMDRQFLGYMQNPVVLVGLNSGFFLQYFGNTHYAIEDLAIMRTIPGMTVLSPADAGEAVMALDAALKASKPAYIRLTGGSVAPTVYAERCDFEIGRDIVLRQGRDVAVFATGAMVGYALQAADILSNDYGIDAKVVDAHTIKPLDTDTVREAKGVRLLVSVEEHSIVGGLGSAIADFIACESGYPALLKLGVGDCFSHVGDYDYLLRQHRLTPQLMAEDINRKIQSL